MAIQDDPIKSLIAYIEVARHCGLHTTYNYLMANLPDELIKRAKAKAGWSDDDENTFEAMTKQVREDTRAKTSEEKRKKLNMILKISSATAVAAGLGFGIASLMLKPDQPKKDENAGN
ncbi:MAG: hypothetical protein UW43_C0004G0045 [Candidatus Yanofskybacteria bacterium GW2011_GWA1_44_21]|uniref:Uncharacterized protein n=2 Tax=Candidatus Yanofskyibacteriota TaxID=1752733 RepID=A0A1F8GZ51_9BACT|nr:MAG: hypothetical protein UW14_C0005G0031 [Candidatus Yanofskybacteria bacterium GW2011_GWA2_44_10]KKT50613.1 MAG: hypothetical protein UW43_C0004G0045 [Candidatus Yanofskybacteria bacterium GW2011_GWA1_44_21]KKT90127.1 MAG: hypothetical protein UW90_C0006G0027 [Candidatus Yanofskybacteria bacterium GW2011_GWB1_45_11]OGN02792.1 MAG: hypothetical protein A2657_01455 [Candidatus Yanofskybacteria bacterium RIFCSPHIGHO2_01_FULL_44_110b]OGN14665.1 MAG: hypothetical protein A3C01_03200 [Candidatus